MRQYEIWWANLPGSVGRRPVLLLSRNDAYSLMSVAADFAVTQVVDGRQGIHVRIPRTIFPPAKG